MKGLGREVQLNNALEVFNWMRPRANMQLDSATVAVMVRILWRELTALSRSFESQRGEIYS